MRKEIEICEGGNTVTKKGELINNIVKIEHINVFYCFTLLVNENKI